jgi:hypothetical protein
LILRFTSGRHHDAQEGRTIMQSTQRFIVTIRANGRKETKRFVAKAEAETCAAGWRKAGARVKLDRHVSGLAPLATDELTRMFMGPDVEYGGWLTVEANEALDASNLLDGVELAQVYFEARYGKPVVGFVLA